ncbi:MAG TPA: YSC84-related protein [Woeseiaceae bacterium]|nr:YSC84-related protein [Woeseiaceae bacterium]
MKRRLAGLGVMLVAMLATVSANAATAAELDAAVAEALDRFEEQVKGGKVFLDNAAGYLVFPRVIKVGIAVGAEAGEGALISHGRTLAYYRTVAGSFGLQLGAQAKSIVIAFMTPESLEQFRNSAGWKVGVDGSVALIDIGAGRSLDTTNIKDPVVGFVFGAKGLMYNLTLEGAKITQIDKT